MIRIIPGIVKKSYRSTQPPFLSSSRMVFQRRKNFLYQVTVATTAAFSTTSPQAFLAAAAWGVGGNHCFPTHRRPSQQECNCFSSAPFVCNNHHLQSIRNPQPQSTSTRLFFSSSNDDNTDNEKGMLSKLKNKVKSVLPTKWFGSEEEKMKLQKRKQVKDEIQGGLNEAFKDAPLAMRMMGKIIAPLMSNVASKLAESVKDQQEATQKIYADAQKYLSNDRQVTNLLGNTIQLGNPISQSSSTININGKMQSRIQLILQVTGDKGIPGMVRLSATQDGISELQLEAAGQAINVNVSGRPTPSSTLSSSKFNNKDDDNIIEAEIIEKKQE